MTRVLVVCGAGASSTFLVHRMRIAAAERATGLTIVAGVVGDVAGMSDIDVLLVGHHLAPTFAEIRAAARRSGVTAVLLPRLAYDAVGAESALDIVASALGAGSTAARPTDPHHREPENIHG